MNPFELLKDSTALKKQAEKLENEIENITVEGSSGGRMVTLVMNGNFEMLELHLDPICVDSRDIKMLEDLIVAAHNDAFSKVQDELQHKTGSILSGLKL